MSLQDRQAPLSHAIIDLMPETKKEEDSMTEKENTELRRAIQDCHGPLVLHNLYISVFKLFSIRFVMNSVIKRLYGSQ